MRYDWGDIHSYSYSSFTTCDSPVTFSPTPRKYQLSNSVPPWQSFQTASTLLIKWIVVISSGAFPPLNLEFLQGKNRSHSPLKFQKFKQCFGYSRHLSTGQGWIRARGKTDQVVKSQEAWISCFSLALNFFNWRMRLLTAAASEESVFGLKCLPELWILLLFGVSISPPLSSQTAAHSLTPVYLSACLTPGGRWRGVGRVLICSICKFLWCKYSYHGWFQGATWCHCMWRYEEILTTASDSSTTNWNVL